MKRNKASVERAISILLKPHGFSKRGSVWMVARDDAILAVWLQSSRFTRAGYINFMAWYPELSSTEHRSFPGGDFHLSFRGDVGIRDQIEAEFQFDDAEIDLVEYAGRIDRLFFRDSLNKLLSISNIEIALACCRANDSSMGYSVELTRAANLSRG